MWIALKQKQFLLDEDLKSGNNGNPSCHGKDRIEPVKLWYKGVRDGEILVPGQIGKIRRHFNESELQEVSKSVTGQCVSPDMQKDQSNAKVMAIAAFLNKRAIANGSVLMAESQ